MKSNAITIILLFLLNAAFAQDVVESSKVQKTQKDGVEIILYNQEPLTGFVIKNYENGKPESRIPVKEGMIDGLWQEWYENGKLKFNAYWSQSKGHGLWEYYHENGVLRQEEFYNLDIPIGIFRYFYNNGQVKLKSSWLNGKKHGVWKYYDENGLLTKTEEYMDDKIISSADND